MKHLCNKSIIGITGGIGSGKSVVSRICRLKGFPVYDCDNKAKSLMNESSALKEEMTRKIGENVLREDGTINRQIVAQHVFSDNHFRQWLNSKVHEMVRIDISKWIAEQDAEIVFIESAILHTSELDKIVSQIWFVEAPEELRVKRVMLRNNLSREDVMARVNSQKHEFDALPRHKIFYISNYETHSLLCEINHLINRMSNQKN